MDSVFIEYTLVVALFFVVATVYSSVGFGGGSSYIAILALFSFEKLELRPTALICNIIVVCMGTIFLSQHGHLKFKKSLPLVITSVPFAFWGGYFQLNTQSYFLILAICLVGVAVLLFIDSAKKTKIESLSASDVFKPNLVIGAVIGFISGLVGIGGGIFLAPVLYFTRWDRAKYITATCSFFILVNSLAGLGGYYYQNRSLDIDIGFAAPLAISVLFGSLIGTHLNIKILPTRVIKRTTAVLILLVSLKLTYDLFAPYFKE